MSHTVLLGVDQVFSVDGIQNPLTLAYITDATVNLTLLDSNGDEIAGQVWPLAMAYVADSNGKYQVALPATLVADDGERGTASIEITSGAYSATLSLDVDYQDYDQTQLDWSSRTELDYLFGRKNIDQWADLDNEQDATHIAERVRWAVQAASEDARLRLKNGPIDVEEMGSACSPLRIATTRLAGVLLYESRGVVDTSDEKGSHRLQAHVKAADQFFRQVNAGVLTLEGARDSVPFLVKDED